MSEELERVQKLLSSVELCLTELVEVAEWWRLLSHEERKRVREDVARYRAFRKALPG